MSFGFSVTSTASFVAGSTEVTASAEISASISKSVESTVTMDKVITVTITCPDGTKEEDKNVRNPDSVSMEYVYQYVVEDGNLEAKTEHFRCHQTKGPKQDPECPPDMCGDPVKNKYCKMNHEGADPRCKGIR